MITEKNIYHTLAYKQMKDWCKGDKDKLKLLVSQFVENRNNYTKDYPENKVKLKSNNDLSSCFIWKGTPQGEFYWGEIYYAQFQCKA